MDMTSIFDEQNILHDDRVELLSDEQRESTPGLRPSAADKGHNQRHANMHSRSSTPGFSPTTWMGDVDGQLALREVACSQHSQDGNPGSLLAAANSMTKEGGERQKGCLLQNHEPHALKEAFRNMLIEDEAKGIRDIYSSYGEIESVDTTGMVLGPSGAGQVENLSSIQRYRVWENEVDRATKAYTEESIDPRQCDRVNPTVDPPSEPPAALAVAQSIATVRHQHELGHGQKGPSSAQKHSEAETEQLLCWIEDVIFSNGGSIIGANLGSALANLNAAIYRSIKSRYGGLTPLLASFPDRFLLCHDPPFNHVKIYGVRQHLSPEKPLRITPASTERHNVLADAGIGAGTESPTRTGPSFSHRVESCDVTPEDAEDRIVHCAFKILRNVPSKTLKAVELANTLRARMGTDILAIAREHHGGLLSLLEKHPGIFHVLRIPKSDCVSLADSLTAEGEAKLLREHCGEGKGRSSREVVDTDTGSEDSRNYQSATSRCLHVGSVPASVSEAELLMEFSKYGRIETLKLVSGNGRRFAFVNFRTLEEAERAKLMLSRLPQWRSNISFAKRETTTHPPTQRQVKARNGTSREDRVSKPMGIKAGKASSSDNKKSREDTVPQNESTFLTDHLGVEWEMKSPKLGWDGGNGLMRNTYSHFIPNLLPSGNVRPAVGQFPLLSTMSSAQTCIPAENPWSKFQSSMDETKSVYPTRDFPPTFTEDSLSYDLWMPGGKGMSTEQMNSTAMSERPLYGSSDIMSSQLQGRLTPSAMDGRVDEHLSAINAAPQELAQADLNPHHDHLEI